MIFYCGLVVHITDTRAQKVVSYTSAHITETVLAHDQHWEEQSCFSSPQLYRHTQNHRKWINHTVGHYTTGVSTCPALRGARHFPSTSYFLCLVCTQCPHIFYYTKAILMRRKLRKNSRTTTAFGVHTGVLNNWGKMKICKKHQAFEAIE